MFGAQLVQQVDPEGHTLSVFGHIDEEFSAETVAPTLDADRAARAVEQAFPPGSFSSASRELVLLLRGGAALLAWTMWVRYDHHLERVFIDARTGALVWSYADLRTDAAVGLGTGVWGDRKKVSTDSGPEGFRATDRLRPPALATWDFRYDLSAAGAALSDGRLDPAFIARSPDNTWSDGAVVDAHSYAGWAYDYFYERHQRRGIDGRDLPVRSVTHFLPRSVGFANAFWDPFQNAMYYGDGDTTFAAFSGALDVVVHELTHGVTQYTWDGIYADESGALNEAFSDIMATGAEFFHEPTGAARQRADYYLGEDLSLRLRSAPTRGAVHGGPGAFLLAGDRGLRPRSLLAPLPRLPGQRGRAPQQRHRQPRLLPPGGGRGEPHLRARGGRAGLCPARGCRADLLPRLHRLSDPFRHVRRRPRRHRPGRGRAVRPGRGGSGRVGLVSGRRRVSHVRTTAGLALAATLLTSIAATADERRIWVSVGGGATVDTLGWSGAASWEEYAETAELEADYEAGPGPVLEAAAGVRLSPRFGLRAAFVWSRRDTEAAVRARIPHPLYFDRFREATGEASGLEYREWASHLDLEWRPRVGSLEVAVFGGLALVRIETDVVERVEFDDGYPFDSVTFRSVATGSVRSDAGIGWSAGAAVSRALGSRMGLSLQARYTRARLDLLLEENQTIPVDAGGLQVTAALQVRF